MRTSTPQAKAKAKAGLPTKTVMASRGKPKAAEPQAAGKAQKPAPEPKASRAPKAEKPLSARAQRLADAEAGKLPAPPNFEAATHKPYRKRLEALVALVDAGDLKGLRAVEMVPPRSSSPKALHAYRDLAMTALVARAKAAKADAAGK
jgi:hypothetical protein